jgi:bromodomain adjacent to zinc finger domain protein 1A
MSDEVREEIESFRERQMDRRKRERDERLGLVEEEEVPVGRKKVKKEVEVKEEDKKKPMKFPAEGMSPSFFSALLLFVHLLILLLESCTRG